MKLVAESLNEFERGQGVRKTLNLGLEQQIRKFIEGHGYLMPDGQPGQSWKKKQPLWVCAKFGMEEFVRHLLTRGADPTANDSAALRWASGKGYPEIVKMLLDAGGDPDAEGTLSTCQKRYYPGEAYAWADRNDNAEIISLLNQSKAGKIFFEPETKSETQKLVKDTIQSHTEKEKPELEPEEENKGTWI